MSYLYDMYGYGSPFGHGSREPYTPQMQQQLPTYNLWTGSTFLPFHNGSQASFAPEPKPKREILRDVFNRRIITKESLFKEPELFFEPENEPETQIFGPPDSERTEPQAQITPRDEWTDLFWRRAGVNLGQESHSVRNVKKPSKNKDSRFKKTIMESLAQPLKSSKAESMMQKMGWQGGALGKEGVGIVEPIAPNIDYALSTIGFGLRTELHSPKKRAKKCTCQKEKTKVHRKEDFITNALLYILEFVQNDWETEIVFDMKFSNKERRVLHQIVNGIINESDALSADDGGARVSNEAQARALRDIRRYNCYVLYTESHGVIPLRQLCLYKDAPEFVYLVTPDDFKEESEVTEVQEDNPFLKSIKRSLEDEEIDETGDLGKLIKYFLEFVREDSYTEFRFLGPFDNELSECLTTFLCDVSSAITDEAHRKRWKKLFGDETLKFELIENLNGSMVIHKLKKDAET